MNSQESIHIMLDLETAAVKTKSPIILEIGAIQFDIDTGREISRFQIIVDFKSCSDIGLKSENETVIWLQRTIPSTLAASLSPARSIPISVALDRFNGWLVSLEGYNAWTCKVWGNGASADNAWISSAYEACGKERPWEFHGDSCVRTLVQECQRATGKNFRVIVPFVGTEHSALDDCRHQIKYLVAARKEIWGPPAPATHSEERAVLNLEISGFSFHTSNAQNPRNEEGSIGN